MGKVVWEEEVRLSDRLQVWVKVGWEGVWVGRLLSRFRALAGRRSDHYLFDNLTRLLEIPQISTVEMVAIEVAGKGSHRDYNTLMSAGRNVVWIVESLKGGR